MFLKPSTRFQLRYVFLHVPDRSQLVFETHQPSSGPITSFRPLPSISSLTRVQTRFRVPVCDLNLYHSSQSPTTCSKALPLAPKPYHSLQSPATRSKALPLAPNIYHSFTTITSHSKRLPLLLNHHHSSQSPTTHLTALPLIPKPYHSLQSPATRSKALPLALNTYHSFTTITTRSKRLPLLLNHHHSFQSPTTHLTALLLVPKPYHSLQSPTTRSKHLPLLHNHHLHSFLPISSISDRFYPSFTPMAYHYEDASHHFYTTPTHYTYTPSIASYYDTPSHDADTSSDPVNYDNNTWPNPVYHADAPLYDDAAHPDLIHYVDTPSHDDAAYPNPSFHVDTTTYDDAAYPDPSYHADTHSYDDTTYPDLTYYDETPSDMLHQDDSTTYDSHQLPLVELYHEDEIHPAYRDYPLDDDHEDFTWSAPSLATHITVDEPPAEHAAYCREHYDNMSDEELAGRIRTFEGYLEEMRPSQRDLNHEDLLLFKDLVWDVQYIESVQRRRIEPKADDMENMLCSMVEPQPTPSHHHTPVLPLTTVKLKCREPRYYLGARIRRRRQPKLRNKTRTALPPDIQPPKPHLPSPNINTRPHIHSLHNQNPPDIQPPEPFPPAPNIFVRQSPPHLHRSHIQQPPDIAAPIPLPPKPSIPPQPRRPPHTRPRRKHPPAQFPIIPTPKNRHHNAKRRIFRRATHTHSGCSRMNIT